MLRMLLFCLAIFVSMQTTPAVACRAPWNGYAITVVRNQLPAKLPEDAFVARIEVEHPEGLWAELGRGIRARMTRVVQGNYLGEEVIVRDHPSENVVVSSSCNTVSFGSAAGYIVGRPVGYENGVLVIQPNFQITRFGPPLELFDLVIKSVSVVPPPIRLRPLPRLSASGVLNQPGTNPDYLCNVAITPERRPVAVRAGPGRTFRQIATIPGKSIVYLCNERADRKLGYGRFWLGVAYKGHGKPCTGAKQQGLPVHLASRCRTGWVERRWVKTLTG